MSDQEVVQFEASLETEIEHRIISGLALPYGVPGNTSGGRVSVVPGAVKIPSDLKRVKLLRNHDRNTPVGYIQSIEDTPEGLKIHFKVGTTPDGDTALLEAAEGIRDALSVELSGIVRSGDGTQITSAVLDAVALVSVPAFADARVSSVVAQSSPANPADGHMEAKEMVMTDSISHEVIEGEVVEPAVVHAAKVPEGLTAPAKKSELSLAKVSDVLRAVKNGDNSAEITAALADITRSANPWVSPQGFVGELWSGVAYQRQIVPLLTSGSLSNWKITGWRWVVPPEVAAYAGDKADVTSNAATTESVSVEASRLAGAHDLDRKFIDFNDQEFIASYFAAMAESYAFKSDQAAAAFLTTTGNFTSVVAPLGSSLLKQVAYGVNKIRTGARAQATFVLVNPADMLGLLDITSADVPAFLALLGIAPENFVASDFVTAGTVIVGAKPAVTFYELGGSPIRVEAVSLVNGGHDAAVFGYYAPLLHNKKGIVKVTVSTT